MVALGAGVGSVGTNQARSFENVTRIQEFGFGRSFLAEWHTIHGGINPKPQTLNRVYYSSVRNARMQGESAHCFPNLGSEGEIYELERLWKVA